MENSLKNLSVVDLKTNEIKIMNSENLNFQPVEIFKPKNFPSCIFLGTSSSIPSKYRNVSSILLNLK